MPMIFDKLGSSIHSGTRLRGATDIVAEREKNFFSKIEMKEREIRGFSRVHNWVG